MNDILRQTGKALRALRKSPLFTLTAVGTLGLAVGAGAAIFTLVDTVLLDPLPYPDTDRLVVLQGSAPGTDVGEEFNLSAEFFIEYRQHADLLENIAGFNLFTSTLRTDERAGLLVDFRGGQGAATRHIWNMARSRNAARREKTPQGWQVIYGTGH